MADSLIFSSLQVSQQPLFLVGGKAAQLSKIPAGPWTIPVWYVLSSEAWQQQCVYTGWARTWPQEAELLQSLAHDSTEFLELSEEKQLEIEDTPLIPRLEKALDHWWEQAEVAEHGWAVRTSLAAEDTRNHSFAGITESYLFQKDLKSIKTAIRRCWASAFSVRALSYRLQHEIGIESIQPAIMLQHMIPSELSGLMFTANPNNGRRDQARLAVVPGVEEKLALGKEEVEEYQVDLNQEIWELQTQAFESRVLPKSLYPKLLEMGDALARHFGSPQEIEWTVWSQQLFVLQSRPIADLPPPTYSEFSRISWNNSLFQNGHSGLTTPLTFSFFSRVSESLYRQTLQAMGISEKRIDRVENLGKQLIGLIHGRMYYRLTLWLKGFRLLPTFSAWEIVLGQMMGMQIAAKSLLQNLKKREEAKRLTRLRNLIFRLQMRRKSQQMPKQARDFFQTFEREFQRIDRNKFHRLNLLELLDLIVQIDYCLLSLWKTPIQNDLLAIWNRDQLHQTLTKAELSPSLLYDLLLGDTHFQANQPTHFLLDLVQTAQEHPPLQALLLDSPPDLLQQLQISHTSFYARCQKYIDKYGDVVMGERKIESLSLRQDPAFLFQILRNYLSSQVPVPQELGQKELELRHKAEEEVFQQLSGFATGRFRRQVRAFRQLVLDRERMQLAKNKMYGLYRDLYLEIGKRLAFDKILLEARDVLYLTIEELEAYRYGRSVNAQLGVIAQVRKEEFLQYEEAPPSSFETIGPVYHHNSFMPSTNEQQSSKEELLQGIECFPGVAEAPVKVVHSFQSDLDIQGQILCAAQINAGWVPLFPGCKGILIEHDTPPIYAANLARSLDIPLIIGLPGLTRKIASGDIVQMDGSTGQVKIISS